MHHTSRLNGTAAPVVGGQKDLNTNHFPILDPNCLLFSRPIVSNPFATPWTLAHQAPLPMGFPGKNTGVSCHFLLQGIFLTQGLNLSLQHWQADSLLLSCEGSAVP